MSKENIIEFRPRKTETDTALDSAKAMLEGCETVLILGINQDSGQVVHEMLGEIPHPAYISWLADILRLSSLHLSEVEDE